MDTAKKKAIANVQQHAAKVASQQSQQHSAVAAAQSAQQQRPSQFPSSNNINSQMFFNQQAQVRQQAAQQFRNGVSSNVPANGGAPVRPQLTPQQQQLINEMKNAEIPRELLQRIPNLPPGVNTWQKVTELAQQKRLGPKDLQVAKQVYQMHQQIVFRSKLQQAGANNRGPPQQRPMSQGPNMNQLPNVFQSTSAG